MARREMVVVTDDLDGTEGAQTVTFGYQGAQYEIDLTEENVAELEEVLSLYLRAGRKVGGGAARRSSTRRSSDSSSGNSRASGDKGDVAAVRAWARENGIKVSERGRIPQRVRDQYQAAQ